MPEDEIIIPPFPLNDRIEKRQRHSICDTNRTDRGMRKRARSCTGVTSLELNAEHFAGPDPFAEDVEDNRQRTQGESNKAEQRVAPAQTERFVHLWAGKGQQGTGQRAEDGVGCHCGGGVDGEGVDQVCADGHLKKTISLEMPISVVQGRSQLTKEISMPTPRKDVPMIGTIQWTL